MLEPSTQCQAKLAVHSGSGRGREIETDLLTENKIERASVGSAVWQKYITSKPYHTKYVSQCLVSADNIEPVVPHITML